MNLIPRRNEKKLAEPTAATPFVSLRRFREEIDRAFERFLYDPWGELESGFGFLDRWTPAIDVAQTETEVSVRAEVPGLGPDDLEITIQGDTLPLAGEKTKTEQDEGRDYSYSERRFGSFRRSIQLPASVDPEKVTAVHEKGTVTIRLEKVKAERPKRIKVLPAK